MLIYSYAILIYCMAYFIYKKLKSNNLGKTEIKNLKSMISKRNLRIYKNYKEIKYKNKVEAKEENKKNI